MDVRDDDLRDERRRRSPAFDRRNTNQRRRSRSPVIIDRYQPGRRDDVTRDRERDLDRERPRERDRDRERERPRDRPTLDRVVSDRGNNARGDPDRDDARRRNSSLAPPNASIDRYVPGQNQIAPTANLLPDPLKFDYQVGFAWFSEWWRGEQAVKDEKERLKNGGRARVRSEKESREDRAKEKELIQTAYDAYKEKHLATVAKSFVQLHRTEEWFLERYSSPIRSAFRARLLDYRRESYARFVNDLENGCFDDFTLEGIYKNDSNGASGVVEKEEGETPAANEVLGVSDLLPIRGGDIRDESVNQPTLLIKTIAPTVSRAKMEQFCREKLSEDENGGGFKWLSLSDPNPLKKFHRIGWVVLHPASAPEPLRVERHEDKEDGEEGEMNEPDQEQMSPASLAATKALAELNGATIKDEERGDFTVHVGIHETPTSIRKKALWDLFSAPERVERDLQLAIRMAHKLDSEIGGSLLNGQARIDNRVEELHLKGMLQNPLAAINSAQTKSKKLKRRMSGRGHADDDEEEEGLLDDDEDDDEEEEGELDDDADDDEVLYKKKRLDLLVEYLRRVHNFCLFCVFESDSVHELTRKCPGGHLRRPRASLTSSAKTVAKASSSGLAFPFPFKKGDKDEGGDDDAGATLAMGTGNHNDQRKPRISAKTQLQLQRAFNWVRTYEEKLLQVLEPDSVDVRKLGGRPVEENVAEELAKLCNQEDENRWRCKVSDCTKLFKGHNFWRKHVEKRHEDLYSKVLQDAELINSYVSDPAHITLPREGGVGGPVGTPRGFNMMNHAVQSPFGVGHVGNMQVPFHLASLMSHMNGNSFAAMAGAEGDRRGVGAIRRQGGGNRFNQRPPHPYARPDKGRVWAGGAGGAGPVGVGGAGVGLTGGGRPVARFAEGGAGQMGPREAVQGRSLKSYEDLDATGENGNNGSGALDY